nr:carboxypeptidase-like regulatory domain-containing protein [Dysgonomonas sp. ZJ709]
MVLPLCAQDYPDYITINGVVKDKKSKDKLEYVSISIPGTSIGTVTNEDGGFSIKVKDSLQAKVLELSRLGYANQRYSIKGNEDDITIFMTANDNKLKEVVIESVDPLELVKAAIGKIADNNSCNANLLTGFYRETVKKRRNYINISEAVVDVYKTPYDEDDSRDNIQVCKGRKLLSPKPSDTLIVKFLGGPNLSTYLDVVKNKDLMLNPETLSYYEFSIEDPVILNERLHYVVSFKPQVILPYALLYGKLYIDKQSLAFSRAEFSLSMDDQNKATEAILRKKPYRLRFKPEEVSYVVTYKEQNGRSYLNYIRNEIRFKCDWKRRLFSTNYTILLEMVMTERKEDHVERIPSKLLFNEKHSLSDKVGSFYDQDFWEDYNIIEPTESLESAVTKLKKQNK